MGRAEELSRRFRADLDRPLGHLSRGNRQKIGLIQAFFHEPELVMLDEPTSGFDPLMQEEFLTLAEERERGKTLLLSSHDLAEVERVCDRVGIIRSGHLVAVEQVADLVGKAYRRVSLELRDPFAVSEFSRLPGVSDVVNDGDRISFKARGEIDPIVKAAARHTVLEMELSHPSLEEILVSLYASDPE